MGITEGLYKKFLDALMSNNINNVVKIAYDYFHRPITVIDVSYKLVCQLPKRKVEDNVFDSILEEGEMPQDIVWFLEEGKYRAYLEKHQKASFVDWGNLEKPRIMGTITNEGEIIGYFAVLYTDYNCKNEDLEIAELFRKVLGSILSHHNYQGLKKDDLRHTFMRVLVSGKKNIDYTYWKKACPELAKGKYVVCVSRKRDDENGTSLKYICKLLEKQFEYCTVTMKENKMYMLVTHLEITNSREGQMKLDKVLEILESFQIITGISRAFMTIEDFENHLFMAEEAVSCWNEEKRMRQTIHFDDITFHCMIQRIGGSIHSDVYMHPSIQLLLEYDKTYNTDFYKTLEEYIISFKDMSYVAEKLGIHRNSVKYRVQKIAEIMGIDFSDKMECAQLLCNLYARKNDAIIGLK